jgi:hypothetical protein
VLPYVDESLRDTVLTTLEQAGTEWKKAMIHRLKQENPEINELLLQLASQSGDPKRVILAGYAVYEALELALQNQSAGSSPEGGASETLDFLLDD